MAHLLGRQDCVESLRKDLVDLQGAVLDVFSRTGPVRFPSWKFPDKLSCNLDLVSLLDQYDFADGEEELNQHSHIVLLELVIDRLLLLLQSFNAHAEQMRNGEKRERTQKTSPSVSIGLVVRHYWNNLIQLGKQQGMTLESHKVTKPTNCDKRMYEENDISSAPSVVRSKAELSPRASSSRTTDSTHTPRAPQNKVNGATSCPNRKAISNISQHAPLISSDTRSVSCQTVVSSLVPCDACAQVQSSLRETADVLVDLCRSEGLPSSLQRLLVAVDDTQGQGRLTAGDLAQWSAEQRRDMGRLGKHLQEVRATVQPLRNDVQAAGKELEQFRLLLETARDELTQERVKHEADAQAQERRLQEAQSSWEEMERRLQEEQERLKRGTVSLEDNNTRLRAEISLQQESLHVLEHERNELQEEARSSQEKEEICRKLDERVQILEAQLSSSQLALNKESAKYQSACRQQESMQVKQKCLLERVDSLDQECEELQRLLGESEDRQAEVQDRLKHISAEKEQLQAQLVQQQAMLSEVQEEKERLKTQVGELTDSVAQLRAEVQGLTQRERLLVAFPELHPLPQGPPQSTGDVLRDMEQQLRANGVRIRVLEQENATLHSSLVKLRGTSQHGALKMTSPEHQWVPSPGNHSLPDTPRQNQQNITPGNSSPGGRGYGPNRKGAEDGCTSVGAGQWDHGSTATSRLSSASSSSTSRLHRLTLQLTPDASAAQTSTIIRQASRTCSGGGPQRRK